MYKNDGIQNDASLTTRNFCFQTVDNWQKAPKNIYVKIRFHQEVDKMKNNILKKGKSKLNI